MNSKQNELIVPQPRGGKIQLKPVPRTNMPYPHDNIRGITNSIIHRLARRVHVTALNDLVCEELRTFLRTFMKSVVRDSATYAAEADRTLVTSMDLVLALQRQGCESPHEF
ncbi:Histone H4 [Tetrabaena socialis]|uniref:Histone H4 n=1 Tax=Tetrabaena socialis TaxID=47790 RepID=A0A2J7ZRL8_9CHLO|nr:Histone H4 [Tetrabaena socialis]|eukprot:PNH02913.1 Histone H4 [Tetrabaena socialis]